MCKYEEIEGWRLSNGKTIREINNAVHDEVERTYLEAWAKASDRSGWEEMRDRRRKGENRKEKPPRPPQCQGQFSQNRM